MTKTILITGSTDGIGKLAAIRLAKDGHEVYLHGRSAEKLESVIREVKEASNNEKIDGFVADFSNLNEVRNMTEIVKNRLPKMDVLINNAGIFKSPVDKTKDGLDIRFAVNYFAPYVITKSIFSLLKKGTDARIINLSSAAQSSIEIGALNGQITINESELYAQSKLALTIWSFYMAREQNEVSVIAVNPGSLLNTNMVKEAYGNHWSPASKGSDILYELALSKEYENITGKYFDNDKGNPKGAFGEAHPDVYSRTRMEWLLTETDKILNEI